MTSPEAGVASRVLSVVLVTAAILTPRLLAAAECEEYRNHFRWIGGLGLEDAGDVAVEGNLGCLCVPLVGLYTFRAADPTRPEWLGFVPLPGWLSAVAVEDARAYVVSQQWGLSIIDLTEPSNPVVLGTLDPPGYSWDVFLDLPLVYVASADAGAHVIDVSDPKHPELIGTISSPGHSYEIAVRDGLAAIAGGDAGVRLHDVSDPENPVPLGSWDPGPRVYGVTWANGLLYAANDVSGLRILQVTNPLYPVLIGSADTPDQASSVSVLGGRALVGDRYSGLVQVDVSDPVHPIVVSRHGAVGGVYKAAVREEAAGAVAYFSDTKAGLQIVDFSILDALEPRAVSFAGMGIADLVIEGDVAYAAWPYGALQTYDFSDPLALVRLGWTLGSGSGFYPDLDVEGSLVVAAAERDGVDVFDVTDPANPVLRATTDLDAYTTGVALEGTRLLATAHSPLGSELGLVERSRAHLYELADPGHPVPIASVPFAGIAQGPAWNGSTAYVGVENEVVVLDVSEPGMFEVTRVPVAARVRSILVEGNEAIVSIGECGIAILDLTDPLAPRPVGEVPLPGVSRRAVVAGDYLHVATTFGFATVYRAPGEEPIVIGSATADLEVEAVAVVPGYVFLGHSSDGILTYLGPCPTPSSGVSDMPPGRSLVAVGPNPFREGTRVDLAVPRIEGVSSTLTAVDVYVASGRRVRRLVEAILKPGAHTLSWDGRDDRGALLPSGSYWIRVEIAAEGSRRVDTRAVRLVR